MDKHPRDRAREEAEKFEQEAMQALQLGEVENALRAFDIAIQNYLEAKENVEARRLFANLGFVFRVLGDQKAAVECVNRALQLGVPAQPNDHAMVSMAGVLDRAGDRRAASLWRTAAESFEHEMPLMRAACFARGIGAQLAHGKLEDEPHALGDARALFEPLARTLTPFEWAGLVGGLGDSAGERGTPFLAQAAWLMVRHPSAYGPSTEPFWQLLVGRMGLPAKLAEAPPPKLMLEEFEELVPDGYWLIPRWRS